MSRIAARTLNKSLDFTFFGSYFLIYFYKSSTYFFFPKLTLHLNKQNLLNQLNLLLYYLEMILLNFFNLLTNYQVHAIIAFYFFIVKKHLRLKIKVTENILTHF